MHEACPGAPLEWSLPALRLAPCACAAVCGRVRRAFAGTWSAPAGFPRSGCTACLVVGTRRVRWTTRRCWYGAPPTTKHPHQPPPAPTPPSRRCRKRGRTCSHRWAVGPSPLGAPCFPSPSAGPRWSPHPQGERGTLKPNLLENVHFQLLPQAAWEALSQWYGGAAAPADSESGECACPTTEPFPARAPPFTGEFQDSGGEWEGRQGNGLGWLLLSCLLQAPQREPMAASATEAVAALAQGAVAVAAVAPCPSLA